MAPEPVKQKRIAHHPYVSEATDIPFRIYKLSNSIQMSIQVLCPCSPVSSTDANNAPFPTIATHTDSLNSPQSLRYVVLLLKVVL